MHQPRRLTYVEHDTFLQALDDLVRARQAVLVEIPTQPPRESSFLKRLALCAVPLTVEEARFRPTMGAQRLVVALSVAWSRLLGRPCYRAYLAHVLKDREPLEVLLEPQ